MRAAQFVSRKELYTCSLRMFSKEFLYSQKALVIIIKSSDQGDPYPYRIRTFLKQVLQVGYHSPKVSSGCSSEGFRIQGFQVKKPKVYNWVQCRN
jgi:hypothetical protein